MHAPQIDIALHYVTGDQLKKNVASIDITIVQQLCNVSMSLSNKVHLPIGVDTMGEQDR